PGPLEGRISVTPPPIVSFTLQYEQQPITVAGAPAVRVLVQATSTAHDPSGFAITSWEWAAEATAGVDPQSSNEKHAQFIFNSLDGAKITLTVESESGEGASHTQSLAPTTGEVFTRRLSLATNDGWYILAGAAGWRHYGRYC